MGEILVVFGSASDAPVYKKLLSELKACKIDAELKILSAHRTPKELEAAVAETDAKMVIAGAGLSAALPGAIAALTIKPVIGIPCSGNYNGLDALLSVHQMPPGIPVLGVGVDAVEEAAVAAEKILQGKEKVVMVAPKSPEAKKRAKEAEEIFKKFRVDFSVVPLMKDANAIHINFVQVRGAAPNGNFLSINVPVGNAVANDALRLLKLADTGVWVGLGRGENAALAAIEILNLNNGAYTRELSQHREEMRQKVIESNKGVV